MDDVGYRRVSVQPTTKKQLIINIFFIIIKLCISSSQFFSQIFSLTCQALFASCIPEIIDLIGTRPKYGGAFKNERGRRQELQIYLIPALLLHYIMILIILSKDGKCADSFGIFLIKSDLHCQNSSFSKLTKIHCQKIYSIGNV